MEVTVLLFLVSFPFATSATVRNGDVSHSVKNLRKSATISTRSTQVAALGRVADLGDLYDARSDNFVEISLYARNLPRSGDAIYSTDNAYASIDYVRTESLSEKMEKLGVNAELSVSFLSGLVSVSGSGKYLNEDKKSAKSAKTSLIYSVRTVTEGLKIFSNSSRELIDQFLLKSIDATHVVVGIDWGANVVLSFEETNTLSSNIQEIQGKLQAALNFALLSASGSAEVDFGSSDVEKSSSFSLHLNGDIVPDTVPQTINESITFIKSIPSLIENENGGKGKIMNYILMPITTVRKVFDGESGVNDIIKEINEELIQQFMIIFQEMKDSELLINDIYNSFNTWNLMIDENEFPRISDFKGKFASFANDFRKSFSDQVVLFRGGETDEGALVDLIDLYRSSNYTSVEVRFLLDGFVETMDKIGLLTLFQNSNALFLDRGTRKNAILRERYHEKVKIISVDLSIDVSSPYVYDIIRLLETECIGDSIPVSCYIEDTKIDVPEIKEYLEGNVIRTLPVNKKEYFFINTNEGIVVIIDANSYDRVISYTDSEFADSTGAVVNNTFYSINPLSGKIKSTPLENIMTKNLSSWDYVGFFPPEDCISKNSAVVNGSLIYFTSCHGVLYKFDVTLKTVTKCSLISSSNSWYSSMVLVENILYIFKYISFYSFDGDTMTSLPLFDNRQWPGLFQLGNKVCVVGGNTTDLSPNPDPVACYDPKEGLWNVTSFINEARKFPGVATSSSGVHIFGGRSWLHGDFLTTSAEVLDVKTQKWSYIPSPFSKVAVNVDCSQMQTIRFFF